MTHHGILQSVLSLLLLSGPPVLSAQVPPGVTQNKEYKQKEKPGRSQVIADKSKPIRRAIQAQYDGVRDAYFANDLNAVLAPRSPQMTVLMPNGQTLSRAESDAYVRTSFEVVRQTLALSLEIDSLDVHGDTAVALIHQHWVRLQWKAGQVRRVDTQARQNETWVRSGDQWQLFRIDGVRPGVWLVDGKRVDPSKPYDPSAPAFEPEDSKNK